MIFSKAAKLNVIWNRVLKPTQHQIELTFAFIILEWLSLLSLAIYFLVCMDGTSGFSSLCHKPVKPTLSTVLINRRNISWRTDTDLLLGTEPTLKEQKSAAVSAIFKFGSSFTCNRHESGMRWYHFILAGYSLSQINNWTQVFWETVLCRTRCVFVNKIASTVLVYEPRETRGTYWHLVLASV